MISAQRVAQWWRAASPRARLTAGAAAVSLLATSTLLLSGGASGSAEPDLLGLTPLYYLGAVLKLVGVLLLFIGAAVMLRRWQGGQTGANGALASRLRVRETVRLSPRQALHLVQVGSQTLLIGATDQSLTLISPVDLPVEEEAQAAPARSFQTVLAALNIEPKSFL